MSYNMVCGGYGGSKGRNLSQETRTKMSESQQGKTWSEEQRKKYNDTLDEYKKLYGKKCKPDTSKKISKALIGNKYGFKKGINTWEKLSDEQKAEVSRKLSEAMKGRIISDDVREKIRKTLTGRHLSNECKQKLSAQSSGRIWINDGVEEKLIKPNECMPKGFVKGRLKI